MINATWQEMGANQTMQVCVRGVHGAKPRCSSSRFERERFPWPELEGWERWPPFLVLC